jgi:hypothetical protein
MLKCFNKSFNKTLTYFILLKRKCSLYLLYQLTTKQQYNAKELKKQISQSKYQIS